MVRRLLVLVLFITSCVSSSVSVVNATSGVAPVSLSVAVMPTATTSATSTTVPTKTVKPVKPVKTTVPVKPKNKNVTISVGTTVPVIVAGSSGVVVLPVVQPGVISMCANKSTSVLRDTANNSCASGEVKVEWLDTGASPKICVNNNREMTLAQDGKCVAKNTSVVVASNKQILACVDDKTGVLRYQPSGVCATKTDPVNWVLKGQGVSKNVDDAVKKGVNETISLIPTKGAAGTGAGSTKTVTTSPATNTSSATTTTSTTAPTSTTTTTSSTTTTTSSSTTTTTVALRASGSFAGYLGGTCPDGSGTPWYWGSGGQARAGGCSAAASIAPTTTAPATTTTAVSATTVAPVVTPGAPGTPTGVSGNTQITVSVTAGSGGTPTSYTITQSTTSGGTYTTGCTVTGASGSCVVTGLTNGTAYFFKTTATNSAGTSGLSTASSSVTPVTVPGAPTIGTATVASATSVTVACTAPGSNGGATITTYTATAVGTAITGTLTSATCSSAITVSGLTTGTAYTFTVTATNSQGTSVASAASNSVTPATLTCATGGTCVVGNTGPGGGTVFYVASGTFTATGSPCGSSCKYLEVGGAFGSVAWCPAGSLSNALTTTAFGSAIGSGYSNTQTMLAGCSSGMAYNVTATSGGKSDWYIPSRGEWDAMYAAKTAASITFFVSGTGFLSSEEASASNVHEIINGTGAWTTYTKINTHAAISTRAIRAFN